MAHLGKDFPYFRHRDLCGEYPQRGFFIPPKRWYVSDIAAATGTMVTWVRANRPRSYLSFRDGWDQVIQWEWDLGPMGFDGSIIARMEWDPDARTMDLAFDAYWGPSGHAWITKHLSPQKAMYNAWTNMGGYDGDHTTDSATWAWNNGSSASVEMRHAGWPDEPNP